MKKKNRTKRKLQLFFVCFFLLGSLLLFSERAEASGTITLTGDEIWTDVFEVTGESLVLDTNGHKLTLADNAVIAVSNRSTFTIRGGGSIVSEKGASAAVETNGTVNLEDAAIRAEQQGGIGVLLKEEGSLTIASGTIRAARQAVGKEAGEEITPGTYQFAQDYEAAKETETEIVGQKFLVEAPPSLTVTSSSYQSLKLVWEQVEDASGYRIYRSEKKDGNYELLKLVTGKTYAYTDRDLISGKTYYYYVTTLKKGEVQTAESEPSIMTGAMPVMKSPTLKGSSYAYQSNQIGWNRVEDAEGYMLFVSETKDGTYERIKVFRSKDILSYIHTGLSCGKTYYYKILSYRKEDGRNVLSAQSSPLSVKPVPAVPGSLSAQSSDYNKINLTWKKVNGSDGYVVYRSTTKRGTYKKTASISRGKTYFADNYKICGKNYYYKVRSYRISDSKKVFSKYSDIQAASTTLAATTMLKTSGAGNHSVHLKWNKVNGAKGYMIYRSAEKNGTYQLVKKVTGSNLGWTDQKAANGKPFYYMVRAFRDNVNGGYSKKVKALLPSKVQIPAAEISMLVGEQRQLSARILPDSSNLKAVKWYTSRSSVASVTRAGQITARKAGTAVITVRTTNQKKASCRISVTNSEKVIVLDPGHGGWDSGASYFGHNEKDLNLKMSLYTKEALEQYAGVRVVLTRSTDVYIGLEERTVIAEQAGADFFVAQHLNAAANASARGTEVLISSFSPYREQSEALSWHILQRNAALGLSMRGTVRRLGQYGTDYYSVIRNSVARGFPGVIIENGFMTSGYDMQYFTNDSNLRRVAASNADAIAAYFSLSRK